MPFPLDYAGFVARFPEFGSPDSAATVQARLDEAALEIDEPIWGDRAATGHGYLTAMKLTLAPFSRDARLSEDDAASTYSREYARLAGLVGGAYRVELE